MRVLVVLPEPPLLEGAAAGRCSVALLRGLREHGVDVTAVAARRWFSHRGDPPPDLDVEVVEISRDQDPEPTRTAVRTLRRPLGALAEAPAFAAAVRSLGADADVVHLDQTQAIWCGLDLDAPSVLHVHYLIREDRPLGPPWRQGFKHSLETVLAERAAGRVHDALVASSPAVAERLRAASSATRIVEAPLSLTPADYPSAALIGPPVAGLIGTAAWPPTRAAARRLVEDVWPEVRRRVPAAQLHIAGRGFHELEELERPGVVVQGEVPSAGEFLRGLSLLLYPLTRGSGMKVKVLEALASGVPVVTTSRGAEGTAPGRGVVVAEDDAGLAEAAATLLVDEDERRERGAAAQESFRLRYAPGPATEPLVRLYADLLGR